MCNAGQELGVSPDGHDICYDCFMENYRKYLKDCPTFLQIHEELLAEEAREKRAQEELWRKKQEAIQKGVSKYTVYSIIDCPLR